MPTRERAAKAKMAAVSPAQGRKFAAAQKIQALEGKAFTLGVEQGRGELFAALSKIEARLEFLNERDNMASFSLAGGAELPPKIDKYDRAEKRLEADADLADAMNRLLVLKPEDLRAAVREAILSRPDEPAGATNEAAPPPTVRSRLQDLESRLSALEGYLGSRFTVEDERIAKLEAEVGL